MLVLALLRDSPVAMFIFIVCMQSYNDSSINNNGVVNNLDASVSKDVQSSLPPCQYRPCTITSTAS